MTPVELLALLRAQADVRLVDGQLEIGARRDALSPELRTEVTRQKHELAAVLEAEATAALKSEAAAQVVADSGEIGCQHPHVVICNGVLECQRCDMRRPVSPADEADAPLPEEHAETHRQLVAAGRDIVAALAARSITVRLAEDGRPWASPSELLDEADLALLSAHRDALLAALRAESNPPAVERPEISGEQSPLSRENVVMLHVNVAGGDPLAIDHIADVLARHPGSDEVRLHIVSGDRVVTMEVGEGFRVTAGPAVAAELNACFGREVAWLGPDEASDQAGMPGDEPEAGDRAPVQPDRARIDAESASGAVIAGDIVSPQETPRSDSTAAGGLVPGHEGLPAAVGADMPAGRLKLGTGVPVLLVPAKARGRDHEAPGANVSGAGPHIEAGDQALAVERVMVTAAADWERVKADLLAEPVLGIDTEATGLDPFTSKLRLVQIATRGRVYLADVFRLDPRALQPVLDHAPRLVGHNLKYDLQMLMAAGLVQPMDIGRRVSDTMLAGQVLGAGLDGQRYRLADLVQRYLGVELDKTEQVSDWSGELTQAQLAYAARDAAVLLPLRERMRDELERADLGQVALIESRALPAMAWLEQTGAPFDQAAWLLLAEGAERRRRELERELDAMAPSDSPVLPLVGLDEVSSRWSSPLQVLRLLEARGLVLSDTRDGTLQEHRSDDPLIPLLLEHRDAAKRAGAFGRDFLRFVHPTTGRMHADYFQAGTAAGRMACRNPNLQQMPRDPAYRACVRAPEGRVLVKCDYAAIEMRIAAEVAGDTRLIEAFDGGADVHRLTAASILGRPEGTTTKADRQLAKSCNFGLLYGMGAARLCSYARFAYGVEMTDDEAVAYRERFFDTYGGLRRWHRRQPDGVVETRTLAGRRRLGVERFTEKLNSPVQGSGADGLKLALGLLHETRDEMPSAAPILAVHDEIVLECDERDAERAREWLERCMREGMVELLERVPVEVEGQIGRDWSMTERPAEEAA